LGVRFRTTIYLARIMVKAWTRGVVLSLGVAALAACGGDEGGASPADMAQQSGASGDAVNLIGAGATFPYPIYSSWFDAYSRANPVRVNYQSIGSGGGIRQLTEGTVDFGASDAPMNEEELSKAPGTLHIPTVVGAVSVTYNLPSVNQPIKLTGPVLADIFMGQITRWNDPRIQQLNPGVQLPDRDILVVHRSDGSGTTFVFSEYLSAVSPQWQQRVGTGKQLNWPVGLGAKGNEGVAGQVKQTEGAIGYVEDVYAQQNKLSTAALQNQAGQFVQPSVEATIAAAEGAAQNLTPQSELTVSLVNAQGEQAYPISTWTYLLLRPQMADCGKARAVASLVRWMLTEGDAQASQLGYAPLPANVEEIALQKLETVTCGPNNEPVLGTA
jgi:phosphate transport system substrate-binding protein